MASLKTLVARFPQSYRFVRFLSLPDLDIKLKEDLSALQVGDGILDDYQYELNLSEASTLLDRCLSYRREYQELAASAILRANDFNLFDSQLKYSKALEMAEWVTDTKRAELLAQHFTAAKFESLIQNAPLASGFAAQAQSAETASETSITGEKARKTLVEGRWEILEQNQRHLKDVYNTPGSVLNYNDRALRIRYFLRQDFIAAVAKTLSAQRGMKAIFGCPTDSSWIQSEEPLDDLVLLVRGLVRDVQKFTQSDCEFVALCEVVTEGSNQVILKSLNSIIPLEPTKTALAGGEFGNLRVKAIGARLRMRSWPEPSHENQTLIAGNVSISYKGGQAVTLPHVGVVGPPEAGDFTRSPIILNRPPWVAGSNFSGQDWSFTLDKFNHPDDNTTNLALAGLVHSIVFHFVISGRNGTLKLREPIAKESIG